MTKRPQLPIASQNDPHRPSVNSGDGPLWQLLLSLCRMRRRLGSLDSGEGWRWRRSTGLEALEPAHPGAQLIRTGAGRLEPGPGLARQARDFLDLYLPLLHARHEQPVVIGHLGQSLDACIACASGDAQQLTGAANITHLHRLRALADVIVVGAATVAADNPQLTTRRVPGDNPCRLVIDPNLRLSGEERLFHDKAAPVLRACVAGVAGTRTDRPAIVEVSPSASGLCLPELLDALQRRKLHAVFVEGGGVTVTHWYQQAMLDRLHLAVSPLLLGAGIPALQLPAVDCMASARRHAGRLYRMGTDILWDLDLRATDGYVALQATDSEELERLI